MDDVDIRRSANQLIKSYGDKAAERAAAKVVEYSKTDDAEAMADWLSILLAIRELQKDKPADGEPSD
jgi:hypothetical protein